MGEGGGGEVGREFDMVTDEISALLGEGFAPGTGQGRLAFAGDGGGLLGGVASDGGGEEAEEDLVVADGGEDGFRVADVLVGRDDEALVGDGGVAGREDFGDGEPLGEGASSRDLDGWVVTGDRGDTDDGNAVREEPRVRDGLPLEMGKIGAEGRGEEAGLVEGAREEGVVGDGLAAVPLGGVDEADSDCVVDRIGQVDGVDDEFCAAEGGAGVGGGEEEVAGGGVTANCRDGWGGRWWWSRGRTSGGLGGR